MKIASTNASVAISSSDNSGQSEVAAIMKQISRLTEQLKNLSMDTVTPKKDKEIQQQMIQGQIEMLQARIAQIQEQAAQKAMEKQQAEKVDAGTETKSTSGDGVNRPNAANSVDVYI